jgi:hypothetical protein
LQEEFICDISTLPFETTTSAAKYPVSGFKSQKKGNLKHNAAKA